LHYNKYYGNDRGDLYGSVPIPSERSLRLITDPMFSIKRLRVQLKGGVLICIFLEECWRRFLSLGLLPPCTEAITFQKSLHLIQYLLNQHT
jgi:hypothetical protein